MVKNTPFRVDRGNDIQAFWCYSTVNVVQMPYDGSRVIRFKKAEAKPYLLDLVSHKRERATATDLTMAFMKFLVRNMPDEFVDGESELYLKMDRPNHLY